MADRCPRCDRERMPVDELEARAPLTVKDGWPTDSRLCMGRRYTGECQAHAVDWRARSLAAEARAAELEQMVAALNARLNNADEKIRRLKKASERRVENRAEKVAQWKDLEAQRDEARQRATREAAGRDALGEALEAAIVPLEAIAEVYDDKIGPNLREAIEEMRALAVPALAALAEDRRNGGDHAARRGGEKGGG